MTELLADALTAPLATTFLGRALLAEAATREALAAALADPTAAPRVWFAATHGLAWPPADPLQRELQGSLLCQGWPGRGEVGEAQRFTAADLPAELPPGGWLGFLVACYAAGTPCFDAVGAAREARRQATRPFVSRLAQALLSRPGGALGLLAHVDRAWTASFSDPLAGIERQPFERALAALDAGAPLGVVGREFRSRSAALLMRLSLLLEQRGRGEAVSDLELVDAWTLANDARNYVVLGDPAARLTPLSEPRPARL